MTRRSVTTTAGAIIVKHDKDNQSILLTRRNIEPFHGHWCLPGGHIDLFETAQDAVIREVKEETGLTFVPQFFGYFDEIIQEQNIHNVVLIFVGTASGSLAPQETEVSEIGWFSIADAQSLTLAFRHNVIIDAYRRSPERTNP